MKSKHKAPSMAKIAGAWLTAIVLCALAGSVFVALSPAIRAEGFVAEAVAGSVFVVVPWLLFAWHVRTTRRSLDDAVEDRERLRHQLETQVAARDRSNAVLHFQYAVVDVLSTSGSLREALQAVLRVACESFGFTVGIAWERHGDELRFYDAWQDTGFDADEFIGESRARMFRRGEGLPGIAWNEAKPVWYETFPDDDKFVRHELAVRAGIRRGVAFPVVNEGEISGCVELLGSESVVFDTALLDVLAAAGAETGRFWKIRDAQAALAAEHERLVRAQCAAGIAHWEWNLQRDEMFWSELIFEMIGAPDDGRPAGPGYYLSRVHADDRDRVIAAFEQAHSRETGEIDIEHRLVASGGREHVVRLQGETRFDADGEPLLLTGTLQDVTDEKRAEERILQSERRFSTAFRLNPHAQVITSITNGESIDANDAFFDMTGYLREEVIGKTTTAIGFWMNPDSAKEIALLLKEQGALDGYDVRCRTRQREPLDLRLSVQQILLDNRPCALVLATDVTELRRAEYQLRLAATATEHMADGLVITDAAARIVSVNPAFSRITGYAADDAAGRTPRELLHAPTGRHDEAFFTELARAANEGGHWEGEVWAQRKNGSIFPLWLSLSAIRSGGAILNHVAVITDITEQKEHETQLEHAALHDALTGLANRSLFEERCKRAIRRARRAGGECAVLCVDLDRFKPINDTHGHAAGDEVLCAVAERMRGCVRATDTVARLGGDEFAVLLDGVGERPDANAVARKLIDAICRPVRFEQLALTVSASIGIAVCPEDADDFELLMQRADNALYDAKESGRNRFCRWAAS